jgi:hypothetical protein
MRVVSSTPPRSGRIPCTAAIAVALVVAASLVSAQEPTPGLKRPAAPPSLAVLGWLAGGRWVAASDDPKAPNLMRETFFEWSANGQALRFWSYTTTRQLQRRPYVEGWYVYHPGRNRVIFTYVDPAIYYAGDVAVNDPLVTHEFEGISGKGLVQKYRYTFNRTGPDEMLVQIFDQREGAWRQVVELTYRRQPF